MKKRQPKNLHEFLYMYIHKRIPTEENTCVCVFIYVFCSCMYNFIFQLIFFSMLSNVDYLYNKLTKHKKIFWSRGKMFTLAAKILVVPQVAKVLLSY